MRLGNSCVKRVLCGIAFCAYLVPSCTSAHENFWMDETVGIQNFKKIVVYPLSRVGEDGFLLGKEAGTYIPKPSIDEVVRRLNEMQHIGTLSSNAVTTLPSSASPVEQDALWFRENDYFERQLSKKMNLRTIRLAPLIYEGSRVLSDTPQFQELLNSFPTERDRAQAVENATMADGYVLPRIREKRVQVDISPETSFNVPMCTWTEERGGPNGNRTFNRREWVEHHVIPEKEMKLHVLDMEYTLYNSNGRKVMTLTDSTREYNKEEEDIFKESADTFCKSWKESLKHEEEEQADSGSMRIGFRPLTVPDSIIQDEYTRNALQFAVMEEARKLRNIIPCQNSSFPVQYCVTGIVKQYATMPQWVAPSIYIDTQAVTSNSKKWKDRNRNEHTMTTTVYKTVIMDHFAHWEFPATVSATMQLVDANTGAIVLSYEKVDVDDKDIDAFRHILQDFYKKVSQYLK